MEQSRVFPGCILHKVRKWLHTTRSLQNTKLEWPIYQFQAFLQHPTEPKPSDALILQSEETFLGQNIG